MLITQQTTYYNNVLDISVSKYALYCYVNVFVFMFKTTRHKVLFTNTLGEEKPYLHIPTQSIEKII